MEETEERKLLRPIKITILREYNSRKCALIILFTKDGNENNNLSLTSIVWKHDKDALSNVIFGNQWQITLCDTRCCEVFAGSMTKTTSENYFNYDLIKEEKDFEILLAF